MDAGSSGRAGAAPRAERAAPPPTLTASMVRSGERLKELPPSEIIYESPTKKWLHNFFKVIYFSYIFNTVKEIVKVP